MQDYKLKLCPFCGRSPDVYQAPNMMILMGMPYFAGAVKITHWMPYPDAPKEESDNE